MTTNSDKGNILKTSISEHDFEDLGFVKIDHGRSQRCGWPEVVYGEGKTAEQIAVIMGSLLRQNPDKSIFATRCSKEKFHYIQQVLPQLVYNETARIAYVDRSVNKVGKVAVLCAGTSDLPVAEEAAVTAELMGTNVVRVYDVGVAGLCRLMSRQSQFVDAKAVVVVAGMDGALCSVAGGMTAAPVIAVPTSVGYGASFGGISALLAMLNSCAAGVSVVNIDNGFGGGYMAAVINAQSV